MCPPEMCPTAVTMTARVRPWARAMPTTPTAPSVSWSAQMEPAPMKMSARGPMNSARAFCVVFMARASSNGVRVEVTAKSAVGGILGKGGPQLNQRPTASPLRPLRLCGENGCWSSAGMNRRERRERREKTSWETLAAGGARGAAPPRGGGGRAGGGRGHGPRMRGLGGRLVDQGQPAVAVGLRALDQAEELLLELLRHRAALAAADLDLVDGADGRDFGGGAAEKALVGDVEHLAGNGLLARCSTSPTRS